MSLVVNSHERIEIHIVDSTKEIAIKVIDYFKQFCEDCEFNYLKVLSNGNEINLDNALNSNELSIDVCYEYESNDKGLEAYFKDLDEKYSQYITYKCLKYYDVIEDITAFEFSKNFIGYVPYDKAKEDVSFINEWYTNNFSISIKNTNSVINNKEFENKLYRLLNIIVEKYFDSDEYIENSFNNYRLYDTLTLKTNMINDLIKDIQEIIDFASNFNCKVDYYANFVPFNDNTNFAAICSSLNKGKVNFKYALFND